MRGARLEGEEDEKKKKKKKKKTKKKKKEKNRFPAWYEHVFWAPWGPATKDPYGGAWNP